MVNADFNREETSVKTYTIKRCRVAPSLDAVPGVPAPGWGGAEVAAVDWFHPKSGPIRPVTYFRALYDKHRIYVRFDVMDTFVKVVKTRLHANVCEDSCVEFFVRPAGDDTYFNFEINGGGTMLLYHMVDWRRDKVTGGFGKVMPVDPAWCAEVDIHHSLPKTVRKPIAEPIAWTVAYSIPFALFTAYKGVGGAAPGDEWACNMYKCGGSDHWACWSPIARALNFHQPKFFGKLVFA